MKKEKSMMTTEKSTYYEWGIYNSPSEVDLDVFLAVVDRFAASA